MTHWRSLPKIRTKALAIIRRDDEILACAIPDDKGATKGWRPLGGSVEFGERAADTVARELQEEIFATYTIGVQIGVVEKIYVDHGETGHEVVFLFDVTLIDAGLATRDHFVLVEDNGSRSHAAWVDIARFTSGELTLFPDGLLALL